MISEQDFYEKDDRGRILAKRAPNDALSHDQLFLP